MKFNFDLLVGIGLFIMMLGVLIFSVIAVISHFTPKNICQSWCEQNKGQFIFYECQNPPLFSSGTPCSELKTEFYCDLPNESLSCKDILNNITTMEG